MNWYEAMRAMVNGQKVRCKDWDMDIWISAKSNHTYGSFSFDELQAMDWTIYREENEEVSKAQNAMCQIFTEAIQKLDALKIR